MNASQVAVLLGAAGAIAWVNWYFFIAGRSSGVTAAQTGAIPEIGIEVAGGYAPNTVRVKAGQPVRLVFHRTDTSGCSEEVVFPDFGVRKFLPTGAKTVVEITPAAPGKYDFMCGMSMLRGTLIAEP